MLNLKQIETFISLENKPQTTLLVFDKIKSQLFRRSVRISKRIDFTYLLISRACLYRFSIYCSS